MVIGDRMREARRAAGLTQEETARRAGLTLKAVGEVERGEVQDPHFSTLSGIASALGITVALLVGEESALAGSFPKAGAPTEGAGPHTLEELLERAGIPGPYWLTRSMAEFQRFWRGVKLEEARDRYRQIRREYRALSEEWENQKRGVPNGAPELQERMPDIYTDAFARHFYALAATPGEGESEGAFRAREQRGDTRPLRAVEQAPGASGGATEGLAG